MRERIQRTIEIIIEQELKEEPCAAHHQRAGRIKEEFRRRTKTQASLPNQEAVLLWLFGPFCSGQIKLRRLVGWQELESGGKSAAAA